VPCSGARRQNKVLDEVSAAILGGVAAENAYITSQPPNYFGNDSVPSGLVNVLVWRFRRLI
jgi:hypothetical protein